MKIRLLAPALILSLVAFSANAHKSHYQDRISWARVVSAEPVYQWVKTREPVQQCRIETVATRVPSSNRAASTLAGGVIGGVIGHAAAGNGRRDKQVGAAVGTVIGMAVGNNIARKKGHHSHTEYRDIERCHVKYVTRRHREVVAYDVVYKHHGRLGRVRTDNHPGRRIAISRGHGNYHHHH